MSFSGIGRAANESNMVGRVNAEAVGLELLLRISKNAAADVQDFCDKIRAASSVHGQQALKQWGADSANFKQLADWMKYMAGWLQRCEFYGKMLLWNNTDEVYLRGAALHMALLQTWNQVISLALGDVEVDKAA